MTKYDIFISYSTENVSVAMKLLDLLKSKNINPWIDNKSIRNGSSLANGIINAIKEATLVVVLVTEQSKRSEWVHREIDVAINNRKTILPILFNGEANFPKLHDIKSINASTASTFNSAVIEIENILIEKKESLSRKHENYDHDNKYFDPNGALEEIDSIIDKSEACDHKFFKLKEDGPWPMAWIYTFAPDYHHFISCFPRCLGNLMAQLSDEDSTFVGDILYQETGSGKPEDSHCRIFGRLLMKLGISSENIRVAPQYEATNSLVSGMTHLYADEDIRVAIGAQYALERQALKMISQLNNLFSRLPDLQYPQDLEYFTIHLKDEPEHMSLMRQCASRYMVDSASAERVKYGASELLKLLNSFWTEMYRQVVNIKETTPRKLNNDSRMENRGEDWVLSENIILRFLLNISTPLRDLKLPSGLLSSVHSHLNSINDAMGAINEIIECYAARKLPNHLRLYLAYQLKRSERLLNPDKDEKFDALYKFGISRSGESDWRLAQGVARASNIHHVFQTGNARRHSDTTRVQIPENQRINDELSVYNIAIKLSQDPLCVLGISSPRQMEIEEYEAQCQEIAAFIEVIFYKYAQTLSGKTTASLPALIRSQIADYFESAFTSVEDENSLKVDFI